MAATYSEKRNAKRVPISMRVQSATPPNADEIGFGYAKDISLMGLSVDAEVLSAGSVLPTLGAELRLRFMLPMSSLVITALGKVVRVIDNGTRPNVALEFLNLDREFSSEIEKYVNSIA